MKELLSSYKIDHIEIYTPMAKAMAYWHSNALGFFNSAYKCDDSSGISSHVLTSNEITIVLTSSFGTNKTLNNNEISSFIAKHYCGVKRFALCVSDVKSVFDQCIKRGAFPIKFPERVVDDFGYVEEASIKLFDDSEISFIDRSGYHGSFKPGYHGAHDEKNRQNSFFSTVDHLASELRINESKFWSDYLTNVLGTKQVQRFELDGNNTTGMILNVNQSDDKNLTLVLAEPASHLISSKVQNNVNTFGPGIHHLAFKTEDIFSAIENLGLRGIQFIKFPPSYYELLRGKEEFKELDIDLFEKYNVLVDKENETYLLQKFIKPISDRSFFFYEIVQRVKGYNGFAIANINILKKAEEIEIMKSDDKKTK